MKLDSLTYSEYPFKHWEIAECLNEKALEEISFSKIPDGDRSYDGTRAANHTGKGVDGKLRLFLDLSNCGNYPYLTKVIKELQKKEIYHKYYNLQE